MPAQTIEKVVDDHRIKIVQFHAVRGFKIKAKLYKVVLPVLASLVDTKDIKNIKGIMEKEINVAKAAETLGSVMEPEQLLSLLLDLLSGTFVDDVMIDQKKFDDLFIGNYQFAYKLAYEAILANGFFDFGGIGNLVKSQLTQSSPVN